jgi:ribosomal protein S18 acetylase RimI-like enzyme
MFDARFQIRLLGPADAPLLAQADPELFDRPLHAGWSAEFFADPRHHIAVALVEGRVVGSATAVHHVHPDQAATLYIVEVAVAQAHRQRGIAKALLAQLLAHGRALGCTTAWVGTEADNAAARSLYAAAGGRLDAEPFVTYSFSLQGAAGAAQ